MISESTMSFRSLKKFQIGKKNNMPEKEGNNRTIRNKAVTF